MDNSLRQDFLKRTVAALESLVEEARRCENTEIFPAAFRREAFRSLHTIKGTAQTIGFVKSGKFAHELENLLAAASVETKKNESDSPAENYKTLFVEGLQILKKTFEQTDFEIPAAFLERIGARLSTGNDEEQTDFSQIPNEIFSQLTNAEKAALAAALQTRKRIFCLEIDFDLANFADEFAAFRQTLCEKCEIIATLPPAAKSEAASGKIGFRILLSTADDITETLRRNRAAVVFQFPADESSNQLKNVFAQIAALGETLARQLGKQVEFEIAADEDARVSPELLKTIFDALAHLVRNAVDHAIETPEQRLAKNKPKRGTIKIGFAERENGFHLLVADDGRGIDAEKIKEKAVEKNLISNGVGDLPEQAALDLIFSPEFSTRETLSEISGRGVGLDAVKTAVENSGGKIVVKSEREAATTFKIFLPRQEG